MDVTAGFLVWKMTTGSPDRLIPPPPPPDFLPADGVTGKEAHSFTYEF